MTENKRLNFGLSRVDINHSSLSSPTANIIDDFAVFLFVYYWISEKWSDVRIRAGNNPGFLEFFLGFL